MVKNAKRSQSLGQLGEKLAQKLLQNKGYTILATHFTCHWGEIDIIACKNNKIVFVEVKTRASWRKGAPHEAVTKLKIRHLLRPIRFYLLQNKLWQYKLSLDVIAISLDQSGNPIRIDHFESLDISHEQFF